jgi:hypothetical protein
MSSKSKKGSAVEEVRAAYAVPVPVPVPVPETFPDPVPETDPETFPDPVPVPETDPDWDPIDAIGAAPLRRDMTIEDLAAEYEAIYGHEPKSENRRYLLWRLSAGGMSRCKAGIPRAERSHEAIPHKVIPFTVRAETCEKLDKAIAVMTGGSRMAFLRGAILAALRAAEVPDSAIDAAILALSAECG